MTLSLPRDDELSGPSLETLRNLAPLNIFRMAARAPTILPAFADLARAVLMGAELDARAREIAVLRVTHVCGASYAWTQHVALAKLLGVSDDDIARIGADPVQGLDEESSLLCRVAEEITRDVRLSDEALAQVVERYGQRQATELIFCCSYFNLVARFAESTRVPLEGSP